MSHRPDEGEWQRYFEDRLSAEEREAYEAHLTGCAECLLVYMACLERQEGQLPGLPDQKRFAAEAMSRYEREQTEAPGLPHLTEPVTPFKSKTAQNEEPPDRWYRRTLWHYAIAATVTLALTSTGVFQTLLLRINEENSAEAAGEYQERGSVSRLLLDRTVVMLDSLQPKRGRGDAP